MADVWGMGRGMAGAWGKVVLRLWERDAGCWMLELGWNIHGQLGGRDENRSGKGTTGVAGPWRREEREGMKGQGNTHTHTGMNWVFNYRSKLPAGLATWDRPCRACLLDRASSVCVSGRTDHGRPASQRSHTGNLAVALWTRASVCRVARGCGSGLTFPTDPGKRIQGRGQKFGTIWKTCLSFASRTPSLLLVVSSASVVARIVDATMGPPSTSPFFLF